MGGGPDGERRMTSINSSVVQIVARLLEPGEREAVLGDLMEAQESVWQGLLGVLGLVVRRQALLWKNWRAWLAGFGVALPGSFLLMGTSLSVSWSYQRLLCPELLKAASLTKGSGVFLLLYQAALLVGWSWTGGYMVGLLSRRTLWASTLLCYLPCLFCLSRYRVESLPRPCLFLFLLPAISGVRQRLRGSRMNLAPATVLALGLTLLTMAAWSSGSARVWSPPRLSLHWALSLPAWYLVAMARKPAAVAIRD
jgi:hypothetical protein